jgi:hypothetical protein
MVSARDKKGGRALVFFVRRTPTVFATAPEARKKKETGVREEE